MTNILKSKTDDDFHSLSLCVLTSIYSYEVMTNIPAVNNAEQLESIILSANELAEKPANYQTKKCKA